jgi:hypothetical protein
MRSLATLQAVRLISGHPRQLATIAIALTVVLAFALRWRMVQITGGLEPDYFKWSEAHYYSGLLSGHLQTANALVLGTWHRINLMYPPGYGAILAAANLAGLGNLQNFRIFQIAIDAFGCVLAYWVARGLGCSRPWSAIAALGYATVPWWIFGSAVVMGEALVPFLTMAVLAALLRAKRKGRPIDWALAGLIASAASLLRTELVILAIPLAIFAVLVMPPGKRLLSVGLVLTCFFAPRLAVSTINYSHFGIFGVARDVKYYILYSGLGQVPNDFGYVTNDAASSQHLKSLGMKYHSPESEKYWRDVYWSAWRDHPGHVAATVLRRWKMILFDAETGHMGRHTLLIALGAGAALLVCSTGLLVHRRRYAEAMIIAGPMAVALFSLGLMYVELRYVRYASLSYVFATAWMGSALFAPAPAVAIFRGLGGQAETARRIAGWAAIVALVLFAYRPALRIEKEARSTLAATRAATATGNSSPNALPEGDPSARQH